MIHLKYLLFIFCIFIFAPTDDMKSPEGHITPTWLVFNCIRGILLIAMLIAANSDGLKGRNIFL